MGMGVHGGHNELYKTLAKAVSPVLPAWPEVAALYELNTRTEHSASNPLQEGRYQGAADQCNWTLQDGMAVKLL